MLGVVFAALFLLVNVTFGLDNGLGLTPQMGFLTWERYRCITDCENRPDECISESLMLSVTDLLISEGYADAGYEYVGIDDCWLEMFRDENDRLVPHRERFPNGMKYVADYIHSKGLKFALYQDLGTNTCAGYPGVQDYMEIDANTFAEWGVDYVKLDGCYIDPALMDEGFPAFGRYLNQTGRPMMYTVSWPLSQDIGGITPNFTAIIENCNSWRNYYDVEDSWFSVQDIMNHFETNSQQIASYAGPGHWNDPDMLIIGNYGLSYDQSKIQMAIWAILAAPLLISTDLKAIKQEYKDILLNERIIAVNQDSLGKAGYLLFKNENVGVWRREITPIVNNQPSFAFAIVNHNTDGAPRDVTYTFEDLGFASLANYNILDLYAPGATTWKISDNSISFRVNPTGVQMYKFEVTSSIL